MGLLVGVTIFFYASVEPVMAVKTYGVSSLLSLPCSRPCATCGLRGRRIRALFQEEGRGA